MRGGTVKCFAYLGLLRLLEEENIEVHSILGSSGGAVVGGLYANGKTISEILEGASKLNLFKLSDLNAIRHLDIADTQKFESIMKSFIGEVALEHMPLNMYIQLTNFDKHISEVLDHGPAARIIAASCAFPFLSEPIVIENTLYGDGDLSGGYGVSFLKSRGAEVVIDLECAQSITHNHSTLSLNILEPFQILRKTMRDLYRKLDPPDLIIKDLDQDIASAFDFSKVYEMADKGYEVSKLVINDIKELVLRKKSFYNLSRLKN